jgi:uncharacterized protein (TIGR03067 family)
MRARWLCIVALTGLVATAWTAPVDRPPKLTLKALQGKWKVVEAKRDGADDSSGIKNTRFTIADDQMTIQEEDHRIIGRITIDASKKPVWIDLHLKEPREEVIQGICELEKETLKWCVPLGRKKDRPTKFVSTKDDETGLLILQREK